MKLTGKAKEKFEAWYEINHPSSKTKATEFINFEELPESMKWGVYQEFADSEGYVVSVCGDISEAGISYDFSIDTAYSRYDDVLIESRQEAREEAIKKLNELINEK